jgi:hypothetical protein
VASAVVSDTAVFSEAEVTATTSVVVAFADAGSSSELQPVAARSTTTAPIDTRRKCVLSMHTPLIEGTHCGRQTLPPKVRRITPEVDRC